MRTAQSVGSWLWKIPVCVLALVAGQMMGVALASALGLRLPQMPGAADQGTLFLLSLLAALTVALALAVMAMGLTGRWWERWLVLAAFFYVVHGVGNAIEASIFTTLGGELATVVLQLPGAVLGALSVALLFPAPAGETLGKRLASFLRSWSVGGLMARLALAVLVFPVVYFLFGMIIAPIVTPHYARLDFLVIPPMPTMLAVLFTRSAMFLLVSLPVVVGWRLSRGGLIAALGTGHFVAVGLAGLMQTTFFPAILRWTHGIEILADSVCYAWALVWLFFTRREPVAEPQALRERHA